MTNSTQNSALRNKILNQNLSGTQSNNQSQNISSKTLLLIGPDTDHYKIGLYNAPLYKFG